MQEFMRAPKDIPRRSVIAATLTSLRVEEEERLVSQGAKRRVSSLSRDEKTIRDDPKRIYSDREEFPEVSLERRKNNVWWLYGKDSEG